MDDCVYLLRDERVRAEFALRLREFLTSLNTILPHPAANPFRHDARMLGIINKSAAKLHRDTALNRAEQLFIDWYSERGQPWLENWVHVYAGRLDVKPGKVSVQDLGYRWASCSKNGNLNFHWRTMSLPPHIIEYVIVHELAHLHEPHHSQNFWRRIHRVLPDYQERKRWLASNGSQY